MVTQDPKTQTFFTMEEAVACIEQLLLRAEAGEKLSIMRDGRVVVQLVPGSERDLDPEGRRESLQNFLDELKEIRAKEPTGVTREEILEWRHAGPGT